MARYRVVVVWEFSGEFVVDAEDEATAKEDALEQAQQDEPFADNYEVWDVMREDESGG